MRFIAMFITAVCVLFLIKRSLVPGIWLACGQAPDEDGKKFRRARNRRIMRTKISEAIGAGQGSLGAPSQEKG